MRRRGGGDPNSAEGGAGGRDRGRGRWLRRVVAPFALLLQKIGVGRRHSLIVLSTPPLPHLNKIFHVIGMLIFSEGGETRDREAPPLRVHPYTDADWLALHHRKNLACNVRGRNEKEQSESKQVSQSRHSFFRPRNQMRPLARYMEMETTQKGSRSRETCAAQTPQATATAAGTSASRLAWNLMYNIFSPRLFWVSGKKPYHTTHLQINVDLRVN